MGRQVEVVGGFDLLHEKCSECQCNSCKLELDCVSIPNENDYCNFCQYLSEVVEKDIEIIIDSLVEEKHCHLYEKKI